MSCLKSAIFLSVVACVFARLAAGQHPPSLNPPPGIVNTVSALRVPYGRSVYVNPLSDLNIHVAVDDYCHVTVLPEAASRMPGLLSPEYFPCNFGPQDVKYSHLGSRSPSEHKIRLQVRYDTDSDTYIIPVTIPVEILFIQRTVITKSLFLTVHDLLGSSEPIDEEILEFTYDVDQKCQVTTRIAPADLPRYGQLINDPSNGSPVSCAEFLSTGAFYQHTAVTDSPNRDFIPMVVELLDADGNQVKQEYFQITVKIVGGLENTPPMADFSSMMMLDVDQFVMTAITPELLKAQDVESDPNYLVFNITKPLKPQQGEIVSTDDRNQAITSFRQVDVNDLRIAYKPPAVDSDELRMLEVEMQIIDTEGMLSEPFNFVILVKPMNTLAPVTTRNTGQLLYQGQSRSLSSRQNLEISDENNLEDVLITVASGLRHGALLTQGRKFFTPADLDAGTVVYQHDGSNTYSDNIIFRMSDGENKVEFLFPITIAAVDNTPPMLDANTGLTISKGGTEVITTWILSAADIDSEDINIKFVLEDPYSSEGQFLLIKETPIDDLDAWTHRSDNRWEKEVVKFTEGNLLAMEVYYRHIGSHSTKVVIDKVRFHVEDDNVPSNESPVEEFIVKILPRDDIPPHLHKSASLQMYVKEFEITPLTKKLLRYTDEDTDDRELLYTITSPPTELSPINPLENPGKLVLAENPDNEVETFTQAQINHHKIAYKPPDTELGIIARALQFTFSVSDNEGNVLPNQVFTIFLRPVDNKPPQIVNTGMTVFERGTITITPDVLDATDEDTDDDILTFTVTSLPIRGFLVYDDMEIDVGGAFTRTDISDFHMKYQHDGHESTSDKFSLEVSDGMHNIPIIVRVAVKPIDDETPLLALPLQGALDFTIDVEERGIVAITPKVLSATDSDTNDLMLTFVVITPPGKGRVTVAGLPTESFTQENIQNGLVAYQHTSGEIGPTAGKDHISLTLSDLSDDWTIGGNKVETVEMQINILPLDSEAPVVTVGDPYVVIEGESSPIELNHLNAEDLDTDDDEILCVVTSQPSEGFLENISPADGSEKSRKGIPISAFTIADIKASNINYMQNMHQENEPIEDRFTFLCQDGTPNLSPSFTFDIAISPVNDEEPILYYTEFVVDEGGALAIDLPRLSADDADLPIDVLTFTIVEKPKNGEFLSLGGETPVPASSFTLAEVASSNIVYQHDGTETTDDKFEISLSDGQHEVNQVIPITVVPVDDETPRMTINNGIDVGIGESKIISNGVLKATDLDSDDSTLLYFITFPPQHGNLTRQNQRGEFDILHIGSNFTQKDIDDNKIAYTHTGQEGVRDLIKFDVTDGFNPLIDRYFYVNIESIDMRFPDVINKGVTLKEGGRATLTTDILSTEDMNSDDEKLEFTIAHAPTRGHLESTDMPGVAITTFTQLDLAGNKIQYVHTSEDEIKMDSFEFEVTDGFNPVYRSFRISISDVDNKKPVVTMSTLRLKEGDSKLITPFELKVEDHDTSDKKLVVSVTQIPVHGKILLDGSKVTRSFTMEDLNENRVSYRHDSTETVGDSFSFTVTDGTHSDFYVFPDTVFATETPQRMDIEIVPVDNGVPQILINRGATSISELASGHYGYRITKKVLRADDRDSDVGALHYQLTSPAKNGFIINLELGDEPVKNFTQGDIDKMNIFYILREDSNATSDAFKFKIQDTGENELEEQTFTLNWARIFLSSANYSITEEDKFLEVTLKRRGYLGETSFVTITTRNGTAKAGEDFKKGSATQVQFNPGQSEGMWKVKILPDEEYEISETFYIDLSDPVMGILEFPRNASVELTDAEDESSIFFPDETYVVQENTGELLLPLHRDGDLTNELMVICYTEQNTATGTNPSTVLSYSDYISRPNDHNSLITFGKGESEKACRIVIIDDSLYEDDESFLVKLASPMGGRLGSFPQTEIVIAADFHDEPMLYFEHDAYEVDESDGHVEARVWRTGTDLSQTASVTVRSRKSNPESASANEDYVGISETLEFAPGITMQSVKVVILDDLGAPVLESAETFELVLRMPMAAILGDPNVAVVTINDSFSDLPLMQFSEASLEVNEADETASALIVRSGDLSQTSSVRCYTRQASAEVMMDYAERPNTDGSIVKFHPGFKPITCDLVSSCTDNGQSDARCTVVIENDGVHEDPEEFRLVLGTPVSETAGKARIGDQDEILITIKDDADRPVITFEKTTYEVTEPGTEDDVAIVKVAVIRKGDLTQASSVRLFTKDGNADSGKDYNPISKELEFAVNISRQEVDIEILFDEEREIRESFTVRLEPDSNMIADLGESRAIVYINQERILADVTFPYPPKVVSLLDYDKISTDPKKPSPGYPVICVTPCNRKHYLYEKVSTVCTSEGIDDSKTRFRWLVAAPSGADNVTNDLREVAQNTFFTGSNSITLDSIYFKAGSRISCAARAVTVDGDPGIESQSEAVTVSTTGGLCPPRVPGSVGAEPFSAHIKYTGPADKDHANLIKVTISMPHIDGMLPVISTRQPSNFELTLSRSASRIGQHRCSNILNFDEVKTRYGFLSEETENPNIIGSAYPYQFSDGLRGNNTLRFYRNLNLEACLWEFTSYYDMSELLTECGGAIQTDGQVRDLVQSYVSLRVPLFVSYIFHSPVGKGWQHFDQETELRLTFVYDTAILWENGIGSPPESELQGYLYPTSMRINEDGKLVVNFRTESRFRGLFVNDHSKTDLKSMVMSANHPELELSLKLVRSENTYNEPEQKWSFISDYAIRDYSGTYTIKLIPCTTSADQSYSLPVVCNPREPLSFEMDIRFQQVSDPVEAEFSLNTNFFLLSKRTLWLGDGSMGFGEDSDIAFDEGSDIYGRVLIDPVQNLGNSFDASIEKVFVCTGRDGYVPKYDPSSGEYGCLAQTPSLRYRYKVLDKEQPDTQAGVLNNIPFNAKLAVDDPEASTLVQQAGTDGFKMDSAPLFTVTVGREWYMHAVYTVTSKDRARRSVTFNSILKSSDYTSVRKAGRYRRDADAPPSDADSIGTEFNRGTNMKHLRLEYSENTEDPRKTDSNRPPSDEYENQRSGSSIIIIVSGVACVLIVVAVIAAVILVKKRQRGNDGKGQYSEGKKVKAVVKAGASGKAKTTVAADESSGYSGSETSEV